jgi:hypothetical protein
MFRSIFDNPIFARARQVEKRRNRGLRGLIVRYGGSTLIVFSCMLLVMGLSLGDRGIASSWSEVREMILASGVLSAVLLPIYLVVRSLNGTFGAFTLEREHQTYDSLLGSRLQPREIASGKLFSAVWPVWRDFAVVTPFILAMAWLSGTANQGVAQVVLGFSCVPFFAALGLWASSQSKTTQQANRIASLATLGLFFGGPMVAMGLEIIHRHVSEPFLRDAALMTSPLMTSLTLCQTHNGWFMPTCIEMSIFGLGGMAFYHIVCRRLRRV